MRQIFYLICCVLSFCLLCGFEAGVDLEGPDKRSSDPVTPVLEYEETIAPSKSNQDLYQQYHLLIISSIEEASNVISDNQQWAYRMAQSAYKYIALLDELLKDAYKGAFNALAQDLNAVVLSIKTENLTGVQRKRIAQNLQVIATDLEKNFDFKKTQAWIKN